MIAFAGTAQAQSVVDEILAQLKGQGYSHIKISRTLLGRVRLVATGRGKRREIVLNPNSGEILRDFWTTEADVPNSKLLQSDSNSPRQSAANDDDSETEDHTQDDPDGQNEYEDDSESDYEQEDDEPEDDEPEEDEPEEDEPDDSDSEDSDSEDDS